MYGEAKDENGAPVALAFTTTNDELRNLIYSPDIYVVNLNIDLAAQTGPVFVRVICHIGLGGAPAAAHIGLDRERQDQLAAGPSDVAVLSSLRHLL